jgi:hypothetical protein
MVRFRFHEEKTIAALGYPSFQVRDWTSTSQLSTIPVAPPVALMAPSVPPSGRAPRTPVLELKYPSLMLPLLPALH